MTVDLEVDAVIFDLDGVLVDSRAVVDETWSAWAIGHGLDVESVLRTIPGKRTRDGVALTAPHLDADRETAHLLAGETARAHRVVPIPGASALLAQLPATRWGIGTSGTSEIARPRLEFAGLSAPAVFITAEMVVRGKPDPEVYAQVAAGLGVDPRRCVVFEDAPSGVAAATAAGCTAVGVLTWAPRDLLATAYAVADLTSVRASLVGDHLRLHLTVVP